MVITVVIAVLALNEVGGLGALFSYFSDPRFAEDYRFAKLPGAFPNSKFTWHWIIIALFMQVYGQVSLSSAGRFLVAKDGREASRAAWLAMVLTIFGICVWFLPPMVGRFLYETEINALPGADPANGSYAYVALQLLPKGLIGIMIAAMFAATMSSMDTALNGQVGIIVRNIIPRLRERLGRPPLQAASEMWLCRFLTLVLGGILIFYSLLWVLQQDIVLFDAYMAIASVIGIPLGFPMLAGLWFRRLWKWSYFLIVVACLLPSAYAFYDSTVNGAAWTIQDRAMWIYIFGAAATALCVYLSRWNDASYRERERKFFETMVKPIDFGTEIGRALDGRQLIVMGNASLVLGLFLGLLIAVPNPFMGRLLCSAVSTSILLVGAILKQRGNAIERARGAADMQSADVQGS